MRINRREPKHWYYLLRSGVNVVASVPFRPLRGRREKKKLVFYDQMNGNTKAFVEYLEKHAKDEFDLFFLAFPPHHKLFPANSHSLRPLNPLRFRDMIKVAQSDAIITAFGAETLVYYQHLTNIKFVDVWHGIPYRGYTEKNFRRFMGYDETWVSSPVLKRFYEKWGWAKEKVVVTGYARVDKLVNKAYSRSKLLQKYDIESKFKKIVLVAPTWEQKDNCHNPFPFNASAVEFLSTLNEAAKKTKTLVVFRTHLQSGNGVDINDLSNVRTMPSGEYPETEELLYIADVLVSDWSSIVFDFLPLYRPTIFLDVPFPYKDGFTVGKKYRFGEVVGSVSALAAALVKYTEHPEQFAKKYEKIMRETQAYVWGDTLDGKSAERYYARLHTLIG